MFGLSVTITGRTRADSILRMEAVEFYLNYHIALIEDHEIDDAVSECIMRLQSKIDRINKVRPS